MPYILNICMGTSICTQDNKNCSVPLLYVCLFYRCCNVRFNGKHCVHTRLTQHYSHMVGIWCCSSVNCLHVANAYRTYIHMHIHCEICVLVEKSNSNPHVEENVPIRVSLRMTQRQHMINS